MKNLSLHRMICTTLAAISLASALTPAAAASDLPESTSTVLSASFPSALGVDFSANTRVNLTDSSSSMATKFSKRLVWIGCYRDTYMALNLQYNRVGSGLVLDAMTWERNELWILTPVSANSAYFTLAPLSFPDYYITAQSNDTQLRLSKASASDPSVQWYAIPDGDRYVLVNRGNGLAMDTAHGSSATGNPVLNYTRNGFQDAQSWSLITVSESTSAFTSGTRVAPANGTYAILASGNNGKCMNDQYASTAGNGTAKIVLDTYNGEKNEQWVLTNRGNNQYTICPAINTNICLNVWAANPYDGNQLTLATWSPGDQCSLWEIYQQSDGTYCFRNAKTGLWLNLFFNSFVDGAQIVGYHYDGSQAMRWKLTPVSSTSSSAPSTSSPSSAESQILNRLNAMANGSYGGGTYKTGTRYTGAYYTEQCKGFAKKVHMVLFGYNIGSTKSKPNNYQISINTSNTRLVGSLTSLSSQSNSAVQNLFASARPGDFIQLRRSHGGSHSMIYLSSNANGVTVYECNVDGRNGIQTKTYSWSSFRSSNAAVSVYTAKNYRLH